MLQFKLRVRDRTFHVTSINNEFCIPVFNLVMQGTPNDVDFNVIKSDDRFKIVDTESQPLWLSKIEELISIALFSELENPSIK